MKTSKATVTHQEFVERYTQGDLQVGVNKNKAGDFVLSSFADKRNKPAHHFWTWAGIILVIPIPIVLLFVDWKYAVGSFVIGLVTHQAARKSAGQFVLRNMLENEDFFEYVLLHKGAIITDQHGRQVSSSFLSERQGKGAGL